MSAKANRLHEGETFERRTYGNERLSRERDGKKARYLANYVASFLRSSPTVEITLRWNNTSSYTGYIRSVT